MIQIHFGLNFPTYSVREYTRWILKSLESNVNQNGQQLSEAGFSKPVNYELNQWIMQVTKYDHWSVEGDSNIMFSVVMCVHVMKHEHGSYLQESAQPIDMT